MDNILPANPHTNKGGLYLGDLMAAEDTATMNLLGINSVLTIISGFQIDYIIDGFKTNNISHKLIKADDSINEDISVHFAPAVEWIHQGLSKGNVFVHCFGGASRSASLVIGYLIWEKGWGYGEAVGWCKERRGVVKPNVRFRGALKEWAVKCEGERGGG